MQFKLFSFILLFCNFFVIQTILLASTSAASECQDVKIIRIESLDQIIKSQPTQTLYFIDIDDTLFDSPTLLGSKAWRKYITEATKDYTENWHDIFSLFIAQNHPLETVEEITSRFVKELQMKGYAVFALTARERMKWYDTPMADIDLLTFNQLESLGICFDHESLEQAYPCLIHQSEYFKGIFFADKEPKGEYLLQLFKDIPQLPEKVILIDDKQSQVESVSKALMQLGIDHECYWYAATDKKASQFDPLIANIQLYHFWISGGKKVLSDRQAAEVAEQYPDRDADYYLHSLLQDAKKKIRNK